jgi:hypothetical protein
MTKFKAPKEFDDLPRVENTVSHSVHLDKNGKVTMCGIPWSKRRERYEYVDNEYFSCNNCLHSCTVEEDYEYTFIEHNDHVRYDKDGILLVTKEDADIDPLGVLDDDAPDGAYWAMWEEVYGGGW